MVSGSEFKKRLRARELLLGTMLALFRNPKWVSSISNLNFDFVVIDSEHAPRDRGEISDLVSAFRNTNTVPIVRVPGVSSHHVTQAIDLGAAGVIIPYCETVEQVKSVVGAAKWNPLKGIALEKVMDNNDFPSLETKKYLENENKDVICIVGIESVFAVENLPKILEIQGIDAIFVGPNDLSISMGIPRDFSNPKYDQMLEKILSLCEEKSVPLMVHHQTVELQKKWIKKGVKFVLYTTDEKALNSTMRNEFNILREVGGFSDDEKFIEDIEVKI